LTKGKDMQIELQLFGILRDRVAGAGSGRLAVTLADDATVGALLSQLGVSGPVQVAVDGVVVHDRTTVLADGETVQIFRSAAGG
jgi:sulfur carrier protein ThiS